MYELFVKLVWLWNEHSPLYKNEYNGTPSLSRQYLSGFVKILSTPSVTGSVFMRRFKLFLWQCKAREDPLFSLFQNNLNNVNLWYRFFNEVLYSIMR